MSCARIVADSSRFISLCVGQVYVYTILYLSIFSDSLTASAPQIFVCVVPMIGFLGACVVSTCYRIGWLRKRKYMVLYTIELSYLIYIFGSIWVSVFGKFTD